MKTFLTKEIPSHRFISVCRSRVQVNTALEPPAIEGSRFLAAEQQFVPGLPISTHTTKKQSKPQAKAWPLPNNNKAKASEWGCAPVCLFKCVCIFVRDTHLNPGKEREREGYASPGSKKTDLKSNESVMVGFGLVSAARWARYSVSSL